MLKLGKKQLILDLQHPLACVPAALAAYRLDLAGGGARLVYTYDASMEDTGITALLRDLVTAGIPFKDLKTEQSSLEDIFVTLVKEPA